MRKKIIITIGDPAGIGPEVTVKAINTLPSNIIKNVILVGDKKVFERYTLEPRANVVEVGVVKKRTEVAPGTPNYVSTMASIAYLDAAIDLINDMRKAGGQAVSLVTAPINKELVNSVKKGFTGHTGYLKERFGVYGPVEMIFLFGRKSVLLATTHIPLKRVPASITKKRVANCIKNSLDFMAALKNKGRMAILGLNPHAGEHGLLGREDKEIILPVVESFRNQGVDIIGPLPADTAFLPTLSKEIRHYIALYHDQALPFLKGVYMRRLVNLTWGLPIIRTSPAHGTAYDIAGRGIADYRSMAEAIKTAWRIGRAR